MHPHQLAHSPRVRISLAALATYVMCCEPVTRLMHFSPFLIYALGRSSDDGDGNLFLKNRTNF
jgi:hypothetical protein